MKNEKRLESDQQRFDACIANLKKRKALQEKLQPLDAQVNELTQEIQTLSLSLNNLWKWGESIIEIDGEDYLLEQYDGDIVIRPASQIRLNREDL